MFVANPPPPSDDTVLIFMAVEPDGLEVALAQLDGAFPLESVRYKERSEEMEIDGTTASFGEGVGFSKDFDADLHFFIMVFGEEGGTRLVAAYMRESSFASRKETVLEVIRSITRVGAPADGDAQ